MRGWWSALCEELDLTPSQGLALRRLDPERPLAMSTLAEALACDASNVTGIVDKLETRGLIARRGTEHDRRVKTLVVTERGRALRDRLIARLLEAPPAVRALSAEVKSLLTSTLRAVLDERARVPVPAATPERRRPPRASRPAGVPRHG
jgi:DNA-binding MarR family transcriptional regulator